MTRILFWPRRLRVPVAQRQLRELGMLQKFERRGRCDSDRGCSCKGRRTETLVRRTGYDFFFCQRMPSQHCFAVFIHHVSEQEVRPCRSLFLIGQEMLGSSRKRRRKRIKLRCRDSTIMLGRYGEVLQDSLSNGMSSRAQLQNFERSVW